MNITRNTMVGLALSAGLALGAPGLAAAHGAKSHHHDTKPKHAAVAARRVSFIARVIKTSAGSLQVRNTRTGKLLTFSSHQLSGARHTGKGGHLRAADAGSGGGVILNIVGLQPGELIQITETTDAAGVTTITITLPPPSVISASQTISGTAENVNSDSFDVISPDGSDYLLHLAATTLAATGLQECDTVSLAYHQDANLLIVDALKITGQDADCLANLSGDSSDTNGDSDAVGTIASVSPSAVVVTTAGGPVSIAVDPTSGLTDGYGVGDLVDVSYYQDDTGANVADDIGYVEQDISGKITSVLKTVNSVSLTISNGHGSFTFTPDYANGADDTVFDGLAIGQVVDVTYSVVGGQAVADSVS